MGLSVHCDSEVLYVAPATADGPVGPIPPCHLHLLFILLVHWMDTDVVVNGELALLNVVLQPLLLGCRGPIPENALWEGGRDIDIPSTAGGRGSRGRRSYKGRHGGSRGKGKVKGGRNGEERKEVGMEEGRRERVVVCVGGGGGGGGVFKKTRGGVCKKKKH